jgi:tetratricopeptide (TPR) repeat protein
MRKRNRRLLAVGLTAVVLAAIWPLHWGAAVLTKREARSALASRDLDRAALWLNRAESWFGADAESSFLRARVARKTGDWDGVRTQLQRAQVLGLAEAQLEREQWLALAQSGQLRDVESKLPRLLANPQEDGPEICEAFVNGYFLNYRMNEAARLLDAWIADFPRDPEPLVIRGKIRSTSQFYKDAEQDFRAAWSLKRTFWPAALELADTLILEHEFDPALEIYRRAAAIPAHSARARIGEIKCLRLLQRLEQARGSAQRLLEEAPDSREALLELGLVDLEDGEYAAATPILKKALAFNPRSLVVRQALARALRGMGDVAGAREQAAYLEQAQSALQRADQLSIKVADEPDNAELRYEIGKIYLQYAVPERGVNWLKSALNCDPGHQAARTALTNYLANPASQAPIPMKADFPAK